LLPWQQNKTRPDELTAVLRRRAVNSSDGRPQTETSSDGRPQTEAALTAARAEKSDGIINADRLAKVVQRIVRGHRARKLVRGWIRCIDEENGDIYWFNTVTGVSSWFAPGAPAGDVAHAGAADG
jgi:hypothetical protein